MSMAAIRAQIATILDAVSGVENVYQRKRWAVDEMQFKTLFKTSSNKITGWMVSRISTEEIDETGSSNVARHIFRIIGIYGLQDSADTETTFQALIESIRAAFQAAFGLNGTARYTSPIQVNVVEERVFGSILCHYAQLTITADETVAWTT